MSYPSVLVLDSGVGGLSIVEQIRKICFPLQIHYLADLAGFPYGVKSEQDLIQRVIGLLEVSLSMYQPLIVVIACNTASTLVLDELRQRFNLPFVGVVPAIKPAAQLTRSGVMAVLATEGTVTRDYTRKLIQNFAADKQVILHGSAKLVSLAEYKLKGDLLRQEDVDNEIRALTNLLQLDTVVLACTHFPLLKDELMPALPQVKFWVDSGAAIANRVQYWLNQLNIAEGQSDSAPVNHFLFTGLNDFQYAPNLIQALLGEFTIQKIAL